MPRLWSLCVLELNMFFFTSFLSDTEWTCDACPYSWQHSQVKSSWIQTICYSDSKMDIICLFIMIAHRSIMRWSRKDFDFLVYRVSELFSDLWLSISQANDLEKRVSRFHCERNDLLEKTVLSCVTYVSDPWCESHRELFGQGVNWSRVIFQQILRKKISFRGRSWVQRMDLAAQKIIDIMNRTCKHKGNADESSNWMKKGVWEFKVRRQKQNGNPDADGLDEGERHRHHHQYHFQFRDLRNFCVVSSNIKSMSLHIDDLRWWCGCFIQQRPQDCHWCNFRKRWV